MGSYMQLATMLADHKQIDKRTTIRNQNRCAIKFKVIACLILMYTDSCESFRGRGIRRSILVIDLFRPRLSNSNAVEIIQHEGQTKKAF